MEQPRGSTGCRPRPPLLAAYLDSSINPGAVEVCDTVDNDCNGEIDEGMVCEPAPVPSGSGVSRLLVAIAVLALGGLRLYRVG